MSQLERFQRAHSSSALALSFSPLSPIVSGDGSPARPRSSTISGPRSARLPDQVSGRRSEFPFDTTYSARGFERDPFLNFNEIIVADGGRGGVEVGAGASGGEGLVGPPSFGKGRRTLKEEIKSPEDDFFTRLGATAVGLGGRETRVEERRSPWSAAGKLGGEAGDDDDYDDEGGEKELREEQSPGPALGLGLQGLQLDLTPDSANLSSKPSRRPSLPVYHDTHEHQSDSIPPSPMYSRNPSRSHSVVSFSTVLTTPISPVVLDTRDLPLPNTAQSPLPPTSEIEPTELESFLKTQGRFRLFTFIERLLEWPPWSTTSTATPPHPPSPSLAPAKSTPNSIAAAIMSLPISRTASNSSLHDLILNTMEPEDDHENFRPRLVNLGVDTHEHTSSELGESYVRDF